MRLGDARGFSMLEMLVSMLVLMAAMSGLASLMIHNAKVNKSQQMTVEVQSNARNCLEVIVQKLRGAGWDPGDHGIATVTLDPDTTDAISQIEVFADYDGDGATDQSNEQVLIRHNGNQVEWRPSATGSFIVLAANITNDADGDGTPEPMFTPTPSPDPNRILVQITARSAVPDPVTRQFLTYTVSSEVVLRKTL